jgi:hypothetical protein
VRTMTDPLPPSSTVAQTEGGGTPNRAAEVVEGSQTSPAAIFPGVSLEHETAPEVFDSRDAGSDYAGEGGCLVQGVSAEGIGNYGVSIAEEVSPLESLKTLLPEVEADDPEPLPVRWDGSPTKRALRMLRLEAWAPGYEVERAREILLRVYEGQTFTAACRDAGVKRSTAMAWRSLVPEFEGAVAAAEVGLGSFWRDAAADELGGQEVVQEKADGTRTTVTLPGDAATARAMLALAAGFDSRIKGGDGAGGGSVTVQVVKF